MGGVRFVILCALAAGCRFDLERLDRVAEDGGGGDSTQLDGAATTDGAGLADAPRPDAFLLDLGPFGPPVEVDEISTQQEEDDPTLTGDMLEMYFNSNRAGSNAGDIWKTVRNDTNDLWGVPVRVAELSTTGNDSIPEVSYDGLWMSITRQSADGTLDIYVSARASRSDPWSTPVAIPELNSTTEDAGGTMTADLRTLYLFTMPSGHFDLYAATRASPTDRWSSPALIAELSTMTFEGDPCPDGTGAIVAFSSLRVGGQGSYDLWTSSRPWADAPYEPAVPLTELNTADSERDPWLSPDGRVIYFESDRSGGKAHIFKATR